MGRVGLGIVYRNTFGLIGFSILLLNFVQCVTAQNGYQPSLDFSHSGDAMENTGCLMRRHLCISTCGISKFVCMEIQGKVVVGENMLCWFGVKVSFDPALL